MPARRRGGPDLLPGAEHPGTEHPGTEHPGTAAGESGFLSGPRLVLPVNTYNFGNVPRKGGNLEKEFVFRNEGTAPLVIVRVLTSCSCFKATFPKRPVAPGQEGVIRIVYEPLKSEPGTFNKVLQIYSNSVTGRELLTVQGNSVE